MRIEIAPQEICLLARVLTPYYDNLPNEKKGCFFYVAEEDCIYLQDFHAGPVGSEVQLTVNSVTDRENQVAFGLPAWLFALDERKLYRCVNPSDLVDEYVTPRHPKETTLRKIISDWRKTLSALPDLKHYVEIFDSKRIDAVSKIVKDLYFRERKNLSRENLMETSREQIEMGKNEVPLFPYLLDPRCCKGFPVLVLMEQICLLEAKDIVSQNNWDAFGFVALLINGALLSHRNRYFEHLIFSNENNVDKLFRCVSSAPIHRRNLFSPIRLDVFKFELSYNYVEFIEKYLEITAESVREYVSHDPTCSMDILDGNNVYSYIYEKESEEYERFKTGKLYELFGEKNRSLIDTFFKHFQEYLRKTYVERESRNEISNQGGAPETLHAKSTRTRVRLKKEATPRISPVYKLTKKTSEKHIQLLYSYLVEIDWLEKDCGEDFCRLFSGKANDCIIGWTGKTGVGTIRDLIARMIQSGLIEEVSNYISIIEAHFVNNDNQFLSGVKSGKVGKKNVQILDECIGILSCSYDVLLAKLNDRDYNAPSNHNEIMEGFDDNENVVKKELY